MRKTLMLFAGILIAGVSFIGCKKDSDDENHNQFTVADTTISVAKLQVEYWGLSGDMHSFYIDFLTSDLIYGGDAIVGDKGSVLYFHIYSTDATGIPTGEYVMDNATKVTSSVLSSGSFCTKWTKESATTWGDVASGTLSVTRDGNYYEITFNGKSNDDEVITVSYKGTSIFSNFSDSTPQK